MLSITRVNAFWRIATKKSTLKERPDSFSNIGTHISQSHPDKQSKLINNIIFLSDKPTVLEALIRDVKSGCLVISTGVGTVTM